MEDIDTGLGLIAQALNLAPVADVKRSTEDWPFMD
jgi:hypothetical protein